MVKPPFLRKDLSLLQLLVATDETLRENISGDKELKNNPSNIC